MSRYRETMAEALKKVYEDGHEDVSSSKRMCQTIIEDATQIRTKLDSMSAEDKLDTWWTNKLAKSADNLNSAKDYIMNPIEESLQEITYDPTMFGPDKVAKAMAIAVKSDGQYSKAIRDIEKIAKNLSKVSTIARALKTANEDLDAQPQDRDVKKVKGTQPKKYYKKLEKDTKKKRAAFFKKKAGTYKPSDDDDDYKAAPGDEKAKTKPSTFTKKFKKMYGDSYGYTAMHAKGIAKLNPLRRKDESK